MDRSTNPQKLLDNITSLPINLRVQARNSVEKWIKEYYNGKVKIHPGYWSYQLPKNLYQIIPTNDEAQIHEKYFRLKEWIYQTLQPATNKQIFYKFLDSPSYNNATIRDLIESIVFSIRVNKRPDGFYDKDLADWIVTKFLPYKIKAYSIYSTYTTMANKNTQINNPRYLDVLLSWTTREMSDIFNHDSFEIPATNSAVGIYLFLKELNLNPETYGYLFASAIKNEYLSNYIYKKICEFNTNYSDFMLCLEKINSSHDDMFIDFYTKKYGKSFTKKPDVVPNYSTDVLSEENRNDTIVFGKNILGKELSVREFVDLVSNMTHDYVSGFICNAINDDITFKLSDQSKMFIRDTQGIESCEVITKNDSKTVIRYTDENGNSALFVLVEPVKVDRQTIYGLSLDSSRGSRGMISIEKDRNGPTYKFLAGGAIPNGDDSSEA